MMRIWPFRGTERGSAVKAMAKALDLSPTVETDLSTLGICELTVEYQGQMLTASWYESLGGSPRYIALDGDQFFAKSSDAAYLIGVARHRAHRLLAERIQRLDRAAKDPTP